MLRVAPAANRENRIHVGLALTEFLISGRLVRLRRPSVARAARSLWWNREGLRPRCSRAGGLPLSRESPGSLPFPWVARHRHCAQRVWSPGGSTCTMPCPARPAERVAPACLGAAGVLVSGTGTGPGSGTVTDTESDTATATVADTATATVSAAVSVTVTVTDE